MPTEAIRVVGLVWTFLSFMVTLVSIFSFVRPSWVVNTTDLTTLGLFSFCLRSDHLTDAPSVVCGIYGGNFNFSHLPSTTWQVTCILCACACGLLLMTTIMAVSTFLVRPGFRRKLTLGAGYIQIMAVFLLVIGYSIFPAGLDSSFVQYYCPGSQKYRTGVCTVGWEYIIGVTGAALGLFCPFLAYHADTIRPREPEVT
ncbi:hypothetical protein CAPTEDRAFT_186097 [Capitella teleta]|uniref:Uncharacterized protein n=1 Tax=Capitella teleta TaxID=283909 RepID=R7TPN0_CAPTE|nr:hypothetical protein CAPTEDRAFT_186097 [Capitella teleta]|eukprot:ELT95527.1 hypothetical protein CAPTEDRAFT_186097 [Capitella teleta]